MRKLSFFFAALLLVSVNASVAAAEYNLTVCGVKVTDANKADILNDGTVSFDGANCLTVNKAFKYSGNKSFVESELDSLNILLAYTSGDVLEYECEGIAIRSTNGTIRISAKFVQNIVLKGTLGSHPVVSMIKGKFQVGFGTLVYVENTSKTGYACGLAFYDTNMQNKIEIDYNCLLSIKVNADLSKAEPVRNCGGYICADGMDLVEGKLDATNKYFVTTTNNQKMDEVLFCAVYDVMVGGRRVYLLNASNILEEEVPTVSYSTTSDVLVLKDATLTPAMLKNSSDNYIKTNNSNLKIELRGKNRIESVNNRIIKVQGDLEITGNGSLDITTSGRTSAYDIISAQALSLNGNATVRINDDSSDGPVFSVNSLAANNATLVAAGKKIFKNTVTPTATGEVSVKTNTAAKLVIDYPTLCQVAGVDITKSNCKAIQDVVPMRGEMSFTSGTYDTLRLTNVTLEAAQGGLLGLIHFTENRRVYVISEGNDTIINTAEDDVPSLKFGGYGIQCKQNNLNFEGSGNLYVGGCAGYACVSVMNGNLYFNSTNVKIVSDVAAFGISVPNGRIEIKDANLYVSNPNDAISVQQKEGQDNILIKNCDYVTNTPTLVETTNHPSTSLDAFNVEKKEQKCFIDGRLCIIRDGHVYNALGAIVD